MSQLQNLPNVMLLTLDPTSEISVRAALETLEAQTGGTLDYLVNNAAQTIIMPTPDFDIETAKKMYEINVWGMLRVTQMFAPCVIAAKGTIVNVSSIAPCVNTLDGQVWSDTIQPKTQLSYMLGIYTGSKAAVTAISDTLRLELAPFDVKVVTVVTGAVSTNTLSNGLNFKLPPTSLYRSIEKAIAGRAVGNDGTPRQEPSLYAERVVEDVLRGANWQVWRGGYASIVQFTSAWFPASLSVSHVLQR